MKHMFMLLLILCVMILISLNGQENKQPESLEELLKGLKSDKEVIDKFEKKEPEEKQIQEARSPMEIIEEVTTKMGNVVKELDAEQHKQDMIITDQREIVKLLDTLLDRAIASMSSPSQKSSSQSSSAAVAQIRLPDSIQSGTGQQSGGGGNKESSVPNKEAGTAEGQKWGFLPDEVREEIMQLLQEDIPVLYRELLRLYFKNIGKE